MITTKTTSGLLFGFIVFIGLLPLSILISENEVLNILKTPYKAIVYCLQVSTILLLLFNRITLSNDQVIGLSILCLFVPFTFHFHNNGVTFVVIDNTISSILSWAIAGVLLSKLFFAQKKNTSF